MEKRKRVRFIERNEACLVRAGERPGGRKPNAFTYDLSTGGARIMTEKPYEPGVRIKVRLDLTRTGESVAIDGEVKLYGRVPSAGEIKALLI